ncbi:aspartyl-tRNA synthetase [Cutibacterium acnes JCM 18918]|nr:aspartyl-tRNA synthetase [Cutibacterium acnes JCM 18918]
MFKQLLMVSGMERYYQIARCYRDEDFRADRQPEFTQLDVEMSFVDQDDVIALAEETMAACWKIIGVDMPTPLPRITWHEAMDRYGSDKPDLRFGNEITEVTDFFANTAFRVFQAPYVGAVVMPGGAPCHAVSSTPGRSGRAPAEPRVWPTSRSLTRACQKVQLPKKHFRGGEGWHREKVGAKPGDAIFFAAGSKTSSQELLGAARLEIGRRCELFDPSDWAFCWVVDAPLFKPTKEAEASGDVAVGTGAWTAVHHAFTSPTPDCWIPSTPIRVQLWLTLTTSSSTATR